MISNNEKKILLNETIENLERKGYFVCPSWIDIVNKIMDESKLNFDSSENYQNWLSGAFIMHYRLGNMGKLK